MALPASIVVIGGVIAAYWHPTKNLISQVQHFAVGVILAALALEVFPEITKEHVSGTVMLTAFAVGALAMYGLKLFGARMEAAAESKPATERINYGLISTIFIDVAIDGLIIGVGFAAGGETGLALALGLSIELLFLGMSLVSDAIKGWRIIVMSTALGATILIAAVLGNHFLEGASATVIAATLSFSAAALLYLVTEELLIEAHEVEERSYSVLVLFFGFAAFWGITLL